MSYKEIYDKIDEGYENHSIGSTIMNVTSSHTHRTATIEFNQILLIEIKKSSKLSKINLVYLIGSERKKSTEATCDKLKEGYNINKYLLVLGNVINILADKEWVKKNVLSSFIVFQI